MSYGDKYIIRYTDCYGYLTTHTIALDGYTGATSYLIGSGEPIKYWLDNPKDSKFTPVKGSGVDISFIDTDNSHFSEFIASQWALYRVTTTKSGGVNPLIQYAYLIPDSYKEPYIQPPYVITLSFSDQIGRLKALLFTPDQDTGPPTQPYIQYSGVYSFLDLIHLCLSQISDFSHDLILYDCLDVFSSGMDQSDNTKTPLDQGFIDVSKYYDESGNPQTFYDVLAEICTHFAAQIQFVNDGWVLRRVGLVISSVTQRKFTSSGTSFAYVSNSSVDFRETNTVNITSLTSRLRLVGQSRTVIPALKKLNTNLDYGVRKSFMNNHSFNQYTKTGKSTSYYNLDINGYHQNDCLFNSWTEHSMGNGWSGYSGAGAVPWLFSFNYTGNMPTHQIEANFKKTDDWIRRRNTDHYSSNIIQANPHYSQLPPYYDLQVNGLLIIYGDGGFHERTCEGAGPQFLFQAGAPGSGYGYVYVDSDAIEITGWQCLNISLDYLLFGNYPVSSGWMSFAVILTDISTGSIWTLQQSDMHFHNNDWNRIRINPGSPNYSATQFNTFSCVTGPIPAGDFNLQVRLFSLTDDSSAWDAGAGNWKGIVFDNINVMPQIINAKSFSLQTRVNMKNQYEQSIDLKLGDSPDQLANSALIYQNIVFEKADKSQMSSAWDLKGGSDPGAHYLWLSEQYVSQLTKPSDIISTDLQVGVGMFDFSKVIQDKDNSNKLFLIHRGDYLDKSGIFTGEIMRVFDPNATDTYLTDESGNVLTDESGNVLIGN